MQKGDISVRELLEAYTKASEKNRNEPTPENEAEAEALWEQITRLRVRRDTPVDWNEMNQVADWVVGLQEGNINAPADLVQKAIEAGNRYLTFPSIENKTVLDNFVKQLARLEDNNSRTDSMSRTE